MLACKPPFPLWALLSDAHMETHSRRYGLAGVTVPAAQGQKHSRAQGGMMRSAGREAPITHTASGSGPRITASPYHCTPADHRTNVTSSTSTNYEYELVPLPAALETVAYTADHGHCVLCSNLTGYVSGEPCI